MFLCPTDNKWTRWFWERNWYHFTVGARMIKDPETGAFTRDPKWDGKTHRMPAPLSAWLDCKCYELTHKGERDPSSSREITEAEYMKGVGWRLRRIINKPRR
jgi:hypothetical protein